MKAPNAAQWGFSLVEALVALAIAGLCLGMLYQAVAGALRNVRVDEGYTQGLLLAQSVLAAYPSVVDGGLWEEGTWREFRWQLISREVPSQREEPGIDLWQLSVEVSWPAGGGMRQVTLETIVPEASRR